MNVSCLSKINVVLGSNLMNFIILRESKQASQDRLISIAKEIQKIHPVGAFILYCKSNYNQNMNYGYTPENVDGILFANVLEFNKKTLKERNVCSKN